MNCISNATDLSDVELSKILVTVIFLASDIEIKHLGTSKNAILDVYDCNFRDVLFC